MLVDYFNQWWWEFQTGLQLLPNLVTIKSQSIQKSFILSKLTSFMQFLSKSFSITTNLYFELILKVTDQIMKKIQFHSFSHSQQHEKHNPFFTPVHRGDTL